MGFTPIGSTEETVDAGGFTPLEDVAAESGFVPLQDATSDNTPGYWETIKSLPGRTYQGGVAGVLTGVEGLEFAGSRVDPEQLETYERFPDSPAAKAHAANVAEFERAKAVGGFAREDLKKLQPANPGLFDKLVGGAAESIGASVLPALTVGVVNPAAGLATGLSINALMESGGQYEEAQQKGATDDQTLASQGFGGAVSTALEMMPLGAAMRLLEKAALDKSAKDLGKEVLGLVTKEAVTEGLTQELMDIEANASGWGNYTPEEKLERSLMAAAQGAIGGGTVGTIATGVSHLRDRKAEERVATEREIKRQEQEALVKEIDKELRAAIFAEQTGQALTPDLEARMHAQEVLGDLLDTPLTPEEEIAARVQKAQLEGAIKEEGTPEATAFADALDAAVEPTREEERGLYEATPGAEQVQPDIGGMFAPTLGRQNALEAPEPLAISQRAIAYSSSMDNAVPAQDVEGLTLRQTGMPGLGTVTTLKGDENLFPVAATKVITDTVASIFGKYAPDSRVIINLDPLNAGVTRDGLGGPKQQAGTFGWHRMETIGGQQVHIINPLQFPTVKYSGGNPHYMMNVIGSLSHEVGHAIKMHSMQKNLTTLAGPELTAQVLGEVKKGSISPETLAALSQVAGVDARLFQEWDTSNKAILSGKMTANELSDHRIGIRKLGDAMLKDPTNQEARSWTKRILKGAGKNIETASALDVVHALVGNDPAEVARWLSFDEYIAEQFSKHAYTSGDITTSKFGKWFTATMNKMRELFRSLKMESMIAPTTTFQEWMEQQSRMNREHRMDGPRQFKLSKKLVAARDKVRGDQREAEALEKAAEDAANAEIDALIKAAQVKTEATKAVKKKTTRKKKDVEKAQVLENVEPAEVPLMVMMIEVQKMDLAERKAALEKFPEDATQGELYAAKRQMLLDAVAELAPPTKKKKAAPKKVASPKAMGSKKPVKGKEAQDGLQVQGQTTTEEVEEVEASPLPTPAKKKSSRKKLSSGASAVTQPLSQVDASVEYRKIELTAELESIEYLLDPVDAKKIKSLIRVGQVTAAEEMLKEYRTDETNYDREYSSAALRKVQATGKAKLGIEQFQNILNQQGIKKVEKDFWTNWLTAGLEVNLVNLQTALEQRDVPLVPKTYSVHDNIGRNSHYMGFGWNRIGLSSGDLNRIPHMTVWEVPNGMTTLRPATMRGHWDMTQYVMHTRWYRDGAVRYVPEMQSDFLQVDTPSLIDVAGNPVLDAFRMTRNLKQMGPRWVEDLVQKEIIASFYAGDTAIRFPTGPTAELFQGWASGRVEAIYRDGAVYRGMDRAQIKATAAARYEKTLAEMKAEGKPSYVGMAEAKDTGGIAKTLQELPADSKDAKQLAAVLNYLDFNAIGEVSMADGVDSPSQRFYDPVIDIRYNSYNTQLRDFLLKQYKATPVVDPQGNTWLEVNPQEVGDTMTLFDKENPISSVTTPDVNLDRHVGLYGATVQEAEAQWAAHGMQSPFFLRWFGQSQVVDPSTGAPLGVWRGVGGKVTYVTLGQNVPTAVVRWFSDIPSVEYGMNTPRTVEDGAAQRVSKYYLAMENPLVVEADGWSYDQKELNAFAQQAMVQGHDGLIVRNLRTLGRADSYASWEPANVALESEGAVADEVDNLHWDRTPTSQGIKQLARGFGKLPGISLVKAKWLNSWRAMEDNLVQIQQRVHSMQGQTDAQGNVIVKYLGEFANKARGAQAYKNMLQVEAEKFVKDTLQSHVFTSPEKVTWLEKMLRYEATEKNGQPGVLFGTVRYFGGLSPTGDPVVLNPNGERLTVKMLQEATEMSVEITAKDAERLLAWTKEVGAPMAEVDTIEFRQMYERARSIIGNQFLQHGKTMLMQTSTRYANAPLLWRKDMQETADIIAHLLHTPFTPQGNFGKYVVIVQQKIIPAKFGGGKHWETIRKEHFESKEEYEKTAIAWEQKAKGNPLLKVKTQVLDDDEKMGLPSQLPIALLEKLADTKAFTPEQLDLLSELMTSGKVSSVAARFERLGKQYEGSSTNLARTFADFTWRNSNYIWKQHYSTTLKQTLKAARGEIRNIQKTWKGDPEGKMATLDMRRRNLALMENTFEYLMNPPNEWQGLRSIVAVVYLAYNIATSIMNLSTLGNTLVAAQARVKGAGGSIAFGNAMKDASWLLWHKFRGEGGQIDDILANDPKKAELIKLFELAVSQGVIDQSYAYYLAGYANVNMANYLTNKGSQTWHTMSEYGMFPFQAFETFNRVTTLLTFYNLNRAEGKDFHTSYNDAVTEVDATQNSYTQMNKSQVMRGWKSILTMFMSYPQFMGWVMSGRYERGARAKAKAEGRYYDPAWRGPTAKLWVMYLYMAGLMGVPGAANLMDILQLLARKLWKINLESELRHFLQSNGKDSNYVLHGQLHNFFGFDVSGRFGIGRLFPGTDFGSKRADTGAELVGNLVTAAAGPFGGFIRSVGDAVIAGLESGKLIEFGKKMPGAIGYVSRAGDMAIRQRLQPDGGWGVVTADGTRITWDKESKKFRDLTSAEIFWSGLGFNPTIRSEGFEKYYAGKREEVYWSGLRAELTSRYIDAMQMKDLGWRDAIRKDIEAFNAEVPSVKLKIRGADLAKSLKTANTRRRASENAGTASKKYKGVVGDIREEFPVDEPNLGQRLLGFKGDAQQP